MGGLKQRLYIILGGLNKVFYGRCASAMVPLALHGKYYLTTCPKNIYSFRFRASSKLIILTQIVSSMCKSIGRLLPLLS